ncbi:hypothetical protein C3942_16855 [Solimonas fluminis]|uniref:Uncharacterized protein n=1 Tax=Solimonas fluminis TaxID=2086571 RepID=A0A2S5TD05_9GAMM|nr:hypothetical protein [Solimonas fluminis]PPE72718.1 hypothetical protein C3942_16855 [Solimonas fluminis]
MSENLGVIHCPLCATRAYVRKFARGRRLGQLYIAAPECHGNFMNEGKRFQAWILDNAKMADAEGNLPELDPASPPPPMPAEFLPPPPEEAPEPAAASSTATGDEEVLPRRPASYFPLFS